MIINTINSESTLHIVQKDNAADINKTKIEEKNIDSIEEKIIEDKNTPKQIINREQIKQVKNYLSKRNAPLADYADVIVSAAYKYNIDYRLVAAISIIESGGGKSCFKSYNAWGWGNISFTSWEDGIYAVSKGLGRYYAKGLTTPKLISNTYCPTNADKWAENVQYVMGRISDN